MEEKKSEIVGSLCDSISSKASCEGNDMYFIQQWFFCHLSNILSLREDGNKKKTVYQAGQTICFQKSQANFLLT